MLVSNTEIFNSLLSVYNEAASPPSGVYYTSSDFYDLLGRGEKIVFQVIADSADTSGEAGVVVTVTYQRSNDGRVWNDDASYVLFLSMGAAVPAAKFFDTSAGANAVALGAKGRFRVTSIGADKTLVRIVASVRGEQGR